MKRQRKLSKGIIRSIIVAAVVLVITATLLITNIFVPVKYLSSYMVISNDRAESNTLRVRFLNVGFGDCTVVEFPDGKTMLIDGGNGSYKNQLSVFKTLNKSGIKTIDFLICASVKSEHCGGLAEIVKYKKVKTTYIPYCQNIKITSEYRAFYNALANSGAERKYIEYGSGYYEKADFFFCFLSPSAKDLEGGEYDNLNTSPSIESINNASAVIWIEYKGVSLLLLGDAGVETQQKLCAFPVMEVGGGRTVDIRSCNIVKVSNHGDGICACPALYDLITPEAAIISVGTNNRGCPSQQVLSTVGDKLYRTDEKGLITVTAKNGGYAIN